MAAKNQPLKRPAVTHPASHDQQPLSRTELLGLLLLFGLALGFRLADLAARNLWTDEAWVALAVLQPTPAQALAAGQSTPPLYLLSIWALAQVFGGSEAVLRSLSLLLGMGAVLLGWPLARRLLPPAAAWVGVAAMAASPVLVYFSKELKQYSGDAFFAVLAALLAERLLERPGFGRLALLAAAGVVGLGFSHPQAFVLPAVLAALALSLPRPWRGRLALVGVAWGLAFLGYYALFFSRQVDPLLVDYWAKDFPDFSSGPAFLRWLGAALGRYFGYFFWQWGAWWAPFLLLVGLGAWPRQTRGRFLLYLGGPLLLALGAAALQRYPFMAHHGGNRLMLFSAPFLYLGVAAGVATLLARLWHRQRFLTGALALALLWSLAPVELVRENLHTSVNRSQLKPLAARLSREAGPQDQVYVYYYAVFPFKYYLPDYPGPVRWGKSCVETGLIIDDDEEDEDEEPPFPARLWLLGAHFPSLAYMEKFAAGLLGPQWQRTAQFTETGAVLYCFERRSRPAPDRGQPAPLLSGSPTPPSGRVSE